MFTTKTTSTIPFVILVLMVICAGLLPGCGSKKAAITPSSNSPIFSAIDGEILRSAYTEYDNLTKTVSPDEARQQLLDKLNTQTEGIKTAKLGFDGYTIFIDYTDGDFAAVNTFDEADLASRLKETSHSPDSNLSTNICARENDFKTGSYLSNLVTVNYFTRGVDRSGVKSPSSASATYLRNTAKSKRVLILCPLDSGLDPTTTPSECIKLLKEHGWTNNDITLKMNDNGAGGDYNVTLEDYRQIGNYGIILYFGHGCVEYNSDENNIFLQCCYINKNTFESNGEYRQWKEAKKVLITHEYKLNDGTTLYEIYIRSDLLRQIMGPLPASYVQLATCFGAYFAKTFLDNGAKVFLGWDEKILDSKADDNQINMLTLMLNRGLSSYDAYLDDSVLRIISRLSNPKNDFIYTYSTEDGITTRTSTLKPGVLPVLTAIGFNIYPSGELASAYYLPTWVNLRVTGIPNGTVSLQTAMFNIANNQPAFEGKIDIPDRPDVEIKDFGSTLYYHPFPPGACTISLDPIGFVKDKNGVLIRTEMGYQTFEFTLNAGQNNLQIDLKGPYKFQFVASTTTTPTSITTTVPTSVTTTTSTPTTTTTTSVIPTTSPTTPAATTTTTKPPQTKLKELLFDDGTADEWSSLGGKTAQFGFLVRLTTGTPFVVTKIRIYSYIKSTPAAGAQFTVRITDKDQHQLWELSLPMTLFSADPSWLEIQVPDIATNGTFCVEVYAPTLGQGLGPFIGVDESGTNQGSELLSNWQIVPWTIQPPKEKANFMIRAVGFAIVP